MKIRGLKFLLLGSILCLTSCNDVFAETVEEPVKLSSGSALNSIEGAEFDGHGFRLFLEYSRTSFDITDKIDVSQGATWVLEHDSDKHGEHYENGIVEDIEDGDNQFIIAVTSEDGSNYSEYPLTVYKSFKVSIDYYADGSLYLSDEAYTGVEYTISPIAKKTGKVFSNWMDRNGCPAQETFVPYTNLVFRSNSTIITSVVELDYNGGKPVSGNVYYANLTFFDYYQLPIASKEGNEFLGWALPSGKMITDSLGVSITTWRSESVPSLIAMYNPLKYSVSISEESPLYGMVDGIGDYYYGDSVTLNSDYNIIWFEVVDGTMKADEGIGRTFSFAMPARDVVLNPKLSSATNSIHISLTYNVSAITFEIDGFPKTFLRPDSVSSTQDQSLFFSGTRACIRDIKTIGDGEFLYAYVKCRNGNFTVQMGQEFPTDGVSEITVYARTTFNVSVKYDEAKGMLIHGEGAYEIDNQLFEYGHYIDYRKYAYISVSAKENNHFEGIYLNEKLVSRNTTYGFYVDYYDMEFEVVFGSGDTVTIGEYPQSKVEESKSSELINSLKTSIGEPPSSQIAESEYELTNYINGWRFYSFDLVNSNGHIFCNTFTKDITFNNVKYRCLCEFETESGEPTMSFFEWEDIEWASTEIRWYQDDEGLECYCGAFAPIVALDYQPYSVFTHKRWVKNDFSESSIKEWLNQTFYDDAFADEEKENLLFINYNGKGTSPYMNGFWRCKVCIPFEHDSSGSIGYQVSSLSDYSKVLKKDDRSPYVMTFDTSYSYSNSSVQGKSGKDVTDKCLVKPIIMPVW